MSGGEGIAQYRGFELESNAQKLKGQEAWTVQVIIAEHGAAGPRVRAFSVANTYPTKGQADTVALQLGRDIVDGKVPSHTITEK